MTNEGLAKLIGLEVLIEMEWANGEGERLPALCAMLSARLSGWRTSPDVKTVILQIAQCHHIGSTCARVRS